jgi:hypothetical protein
MDGAGGAAGGSFESIATATGTGSSGTITFSSIPSTYKHLQIRGLAKDTSVAFDATAQVLIRFNSDSGNNYARHRLYGDGGSVTAVGAASQSGISLGAGMTIGLPVNVLAASITDIQDYASTTKNKTVRTINGGNANESSGNYLLELSSGVWLNTAAITSISLVNNNGSNFNTQTVFSLYGIKG